MSNFPPGLSRRRIRPLVEPLGESTAAQARPLIRTLFFSVTVVLFIACANLAGLLLLRVTRRSREVSVRLAPGAGGERGCGDGSLLFEVDPLNPAVIVLAALSIFLLALAASMIPAYRAARVEPVDALRAQ